MGEQGVAGPDGDGEGGQEGGEGQGGGVKT